MDVNALMNFKDKKGTNNAIYPVTKKSNVIGLEQELTNMASSISSTTQAVAGKVDKVNGKGLSTNDFTNAYKAKLDSLDNALDSKADASAVTQLQTTVNTKADTSTVTAISERVSGVETEQDVLSARMDTFTALPEGSTTGDAELVDIRVKADGSTAASAGAAVREQIVDLNQNLKALEKKGYPQASIAEAVNAWGTEHIDEFVPNGSLIEAKFTDDLKIKTIKDYVTPEMFGAVGDGITDDTAAIQAALNAAGNIFFKPNKKYIISKTLVLMPDSIVDFNNATIKVSDKEQFKMEWEIHSLIRNNNFTMGNEKKDENIIIKNLNIDNNGITNTAEDGAIQFRGVVGALIENVKINVSGNNMWGIILFSANRDITINKVNIYNTSEEGSLGGCLWVRTGLNSGYPTNNINISNGHFENNAKDEAVALMSYRNNNSITVNMNNCYITSTSNTIRPDFLLTFRSNGTNALIEGSFSGITVEGNVNQSLFAVSGDGTRGYFTNGMLQSAKGRCAIIQCPTFDISSTTFICWDSSVAAIVGGKISNCMLTSTAHSCDVVTGCKFNCEKKSVVACDSCLIVTDNIIKTKGIGVHYYGTISDIICTGNKIYADMSAISAQKIGDSEDENLTIDSAIITNNSIQRLNTSSNDNTIGINLSSSEYILCKNNLIYVAANNTTSNSKGYKYGVPQSESFNADNLIKPIPV